MKMKSTLNSNHNLHMNSNYMAIVEQKTNSSRSASECRTPIAWHNRTVNLTNPLILAQNPQTVSTNYTAKYRRAPGQRLSQRTSSPSATTTSSDDREEVPMVRHHLRRPNSRVTTSGSALTVDRRQQMNNNKFGNHFVISGEYGVHPMHPMHALRSGTLRSTKSVPALTMSSQMHDPCPVHGNHGNNGLLIPTCPPQAHHFFPSISNQTLNFRRFGSFTDIRDTRISMNANGLPFLTPIPEHKQSCTLMPIYYSQPQTALPALPPPNSIPMHLMPSKPSSRSMVFPAYAEPLPFRNHFKMSSPVSPVPSHRNVKMTNNYGTSSEDIYCRGHLIVLWVILGVVTVGVISGIILAVTMN